MRVRIFLVLSFLLGACGLPKVDIAQIDITHNKVNVFGVTNYNEDTCKMELKELGPKTIPELHGYFCLSPSDAGKWQAYAKSECERRKAERNAANNSR